MKRRAPKPTRRTCRVCHVEQDLATDFPRGEGWVCKRCRVRMTNEAQKAKTAERRRRLAFTRQEPDRFEPTRRALEAHWALPYAKWTRQHHEQHSAWLRRLAGLDDVATVVVAGVAA